MSTRRQLRRLSTSSWKRFLFCYFCAFIALRSARRKVGHLRKEKNMKRGVSRWQLTKQITQYRLFSKLNYLPSRPIPSPRIRRSFVNRLVASIRFFFCLLPCMSVWLGFVYFLRLLAQNKKRSGDHFISTVHDTQKNGDRWKHDSNLSATNESRNRKMIFCSSFAFSILCSDSCPRLAYVMSFRFLLVGESLWYFDIVKWTEFDDYVVEWLSRLVI